jgi:hypothetical protein
METKYQILFMVAAFVIVVASVVIVIMLMNSSAKLQTKIAGMWINESQSTRILIHENDSVFQGDIVWVNEVQKSQILGFNMIKGLVLKSLGQGSTGVYVDPITKMENPFQIWFQGKGRLKMVLMNKVNGRDEILREEKWFRF